MQRLYEDDLVEAAVTLATAGRLTGVEPRQLRAFHAARERCYGVDDPDERSAAFVRLHLEWFGTWGLRARLDAAVDRFPELEAALEAVAFRRSRGRHDEGAELYVAEGGCRRGVVALGPDRLVSEPVLAGFLHHELAHLADMVSPGFRYDPATGAAARTPSQQRLVLERYRLLWALRIDGGLTRRGLPSLGGVDRRRLEFEKAFRFVPEPRRSRVFQGLWDGTIATHADLLHLASDPRELEGRREPVPGAPCPLCGFPTFQWVEPDAIPPRAAARIRVEFPDWSAGEPMCARCAEIYDAVTGIEYPSTVCLPGREGGGFQGAPIGRCSL